MGVRRHLRKLLDSTEHDGGDGSYTTEMWSPSARTFARFAYVAEQYGYRYAGLDPDLRGTGTPFFLFRRLPDAAERAARTHRLFPGAPERGRLPGMRPWPGVVVPLKEARREVALLHARIRVDHSEAVVGQRLAPWLIGIPAVFLLILLVNGEVNTTGLLTGGAMALGLMVLLMASRWYLRRRQAAYRRVLERAGVSHPPGEPPRG